MKAKSPRTWRCSATNVSQRSRCGYSENRMSRRTAWKIAQAQGWDTTFHAEYIAVTKLQADALITIDPVLAAKAAGLVAMAATSALTQHR